MEVIETLRRDLQDGRIGSEQLLDLAVTLFQQHQAAQRQLDSMTAELVAARRRVEELEKQIGGGTPKLAAAFSLREEEKRQAARGKKKAKKKRGRVRTADKIAMAERTETMYPAGVPEGECRLSHTRPVWRLEQGRAVLIAYDIYRGPKSQYGQIPGVLGRSEFGLEIVAEIAHLVHVIGLSFDKACAILNFFQQMTLSKSQANALLNQLARHWEGEFETLCSLMANSMVAHADETGWSINSVWAFLSEKARVMLFGVHKDAATLREILDPATFAGILVSDDAAVYSGFTRAQKCWAHLLRKAVKLTLQDADTAEYRDFTDQLLQIYREGCRVRDDRRLGVAGREDKVGELEDRLGELCRAKPGGPAAPGGVADDYRRLVNELNRLLVADELFTFVLAPPVGQTAGETKPVDGTNNEAERTLRTAALARRTGRTNKTPAGARRQTILTSVLESLRLYLPVFTLKTVLEEVQRWRITGRSCFETLREKLQIAPPGHSVLDRLFPKPLPTPNG